MADITKIRLDSGDYDIKDASARSDISTLDTRVEALENKIDFSNLKTVQDLIYTPLGSGHNFQGGFVDDNNVLYVYDASNEPFGDLLRFNIQNHTYIDSINNIRLYHGNDFALKNNTLYVAPAKDDNGNLANKTVLVYDMVGGGITTIPAFSGVNYAFTFGVSLNGDNLIVALANDSYTPSLNKYVKYDTNTGDYVEYSVDLNNQYIDGCQVSGIEVINGKMYLLTSAKSMIYEFEIDDTNNTLTLNKTYALGDKDEQGLDFCEFQAIAKIPSGLYGTDTFILTAIDFDNEEHSFISEKVYLSSFSNNLNTFLPANTQYFNSQRIVDVHVKRSGGVNLLENGSSSYPFKTLQRAINYINSDHNIVADTIIIDDSETYWLGKQVGKRLPITWSGTPTIRFGVISDCDVFMRSNNPDTNVGAIFNRANNTGDGIRFKHCTGSVGGFTTTERIDIDLGSDMILYSFNQNASSAAVAFMIDRSRVNLDPRNLSGGTTRNITVQNGASLQISHLFSGLNMLARYGANIIVASS